jgi:methyltransferase (TIGR00027 family)
MDQKEPLIRNISDTANWAAVYRARETERSDALFRDPFAQRLADVRGEQIADTVEKGKRNAWAWVTRTYLFDQIITQQIEQGVDMVVNLAAGLDARPYRMALPSTLKWIEVDLPDILDYKENILDGEKPVCKLERVRLDLAEISARRELFERLGHEANKALIVTEGLMIYLAPEEAAALAQDLARPPGFRYWVLELASPGLLRMIQRQMGQALSEGGAALRFGPAEGPAFFTPHGWSPIEVRSMLKTAARLKRLSLWMRLLALLPESSGSQGSRPWSGICLLAKP